jgi:hypothetical protein
MRTELDIIRLVEGAFAPHQCTASPADYGNRLHVCIRYEGGEVEKDIVMREVQQDHVLAVHITQLREFLLKRGAKLSDWAFPAA